MARIARKLAVVPGMPHHVILRGNNRRRLFSYPREHRFFLRRLRQSSFRNGVPVHANVQMSNHVHLVVTPQDDRRLSRFVGFVAQTFAQFRNRTRHSSGKLFEERYKSIPITSNEQMAVTIAYIELNPVRAGICADAGEYPWSTYPIHSGAECREPLIHRIWTPSAWYLSLAAEPDERSRVFLDWFEHYRQLDDWSDVYPDPAPASGRSRLERPNRASAV